MEGYKLIEHALSNASKKVNEVINAFVLYNDEALSDAERILKLGLDPLPLGVKDIIYTKGLRTTMGSKLYKDFIPENDAYVVRVLKESGWVVVGKTNTHEFASGATTTSSVFGPTKNPLDTARIAGGSSGGSAAAVAASLIPIGLGTDTAGSVRVPASLCGVYGYKPTYGLINTEGVYPLAPSLDTIGFLAKDLAWINRALKNFIKLDLSEFDVRRLRLGIPNWFKVPNDLRALYPDLVDKVETKFLNYVAKLGCDYVEIVMPEAEKYVWRCFPIIRYSEATAIHMANRDRWGEYGADVRRLIEKGLEYRAVDYIDAMSRREYVRNELNKALNSVDALITPTVPIPAPKIDDVLGREDGIIRSLLTYETIYASYIGAPAISIPALSVGGLPVGIQIICGVGNDSKLLSIASTITATYK
ncbi:MAG: amidase [Sulfolobales archaeon]|nr:amidase [Sulfolobales archaeon]MCX8185740.1 amidase [Sulfolobales archaeon]MDW7970052.1 amidase [Sulfolobales archaeon]